MRKATFAAAMAVLLLATGAQAQTPTIQQADPVRLQLARELIEASGGQKAAEVRITAAYSQIGKMIGTALPASSAAIAVSVQEHIRDELIKALPELINSSAQIYARNLTESELRSYLAWLRSDAGKSIQAKMPTISQQAMEASTPQLLRMLPKIMEKAVDRSCAERGCTPEQRQQITEAMNKVIKVS